MDTEANDIAARLAEIKESLAAITPGPWFDDSYNSIFHGPHVFIASVPDHPESAEWGDPQENDRQYDRETWFRESAANRAFIAAARQNVPWLIEQLEAALSAIAALTRELPCGCHPRLESLGKPAKFSGGCESPVIASLAIVCADCGAWYCSRECISKHFGNEPNEALSSLNQERDRLAEENEKLRQAIASFVAKWPEAEEKINGAIVVASMHGCPYTGPSLNAELDELNVLATIGEGKNSVTPEQK